MKFLCLAYGDEKKWNALPKSTQEALLAQDDLLRSRGDLVAEVRAPTTVRFTDGDAHTSDGSFGQAPLRKQHMARVSTYLNFPRTTEEAFSFYKFVFGTEFSSPIARFRDIPAQPGQPPLPEADKNLVMHVELPILGGHVLMGTDATEFMGFTVTAGNNMYINLEPDTRAETDRLFQALSADGTVEMALQEMFWGGYFGSLADGYGIRWMFNCANKA